MAKEKTLPNFPNRAAEELYWAGRQLIKTLTIAIALAITMFIAQFFNGVLTLLIGFIGFILVLATGTYTVGHFVRYFVYRSRHQ
ncbi:hypothetical protein [Tumebacillus permanentifrigoris]|uniref:Uncharacterized protein n=1 Tax=Tumebacillus permanentifrigoris TaxID=378543 RepID=A0A316DRB5_9BACL|nr:hypothetical protein [Tumebacillus permanentifrigoris]PWK06996.1 hypothetical protein C7459_11866 [Tumebacillus permanentifrigoris]